MSRIFYKILIALYSIFGSWAFRFFSWIVATGYYLFFPWRVAVGVRFYRTLFPERGMLHHLLCAWRQYHNFTRVYLDRYLVQHTADITWTSEGLEHLFSASEKGTGGVILMSHIGNWEIAAHLLQNRGMRLLLYMGIREKEKVEGMQKESLAGRGIRIVAVEKDRESPLDILEGLHFIREGGFVSLPGDRVWREGQRTVAARFLGRTVRLPEAPHLLALISGAPLFVFFIFATGKTSYHITCSEPLYVKAPSRDRKQDAIIATAQKYAARLEQAVREHPFEWYHFEEFLGKGDTQ